MRVAERLLVRVVEWVVKGIVREVERATALPIALDGLKLEDALAGDAGPEGFD